MIGDTTIDLDDPSRFDIINIYPRWLKEKFIEYDQSNWSEFNRIISNRTIEHQQKKLKEMSSELKRTIELLERNVEEVLSLILQYLLYRHKK